MFMGFDIETEPLSEAEIVAIRGSFDPSKVKLGNLKDKKKIQEKLDEEEAKWNDPAAVTLDARLCKICAIGYVDDKGNKKCKTVLEPNTDEAKLLTDFWISQRTVIQRSGWICGFNCKGYDLPFLRRRSWICDVKVPLDLISKAKFWNQHYVDLLEEWRSGQTWSDASCGGLDGLARAFGLPPKKGNGVHFHKLLRSGDPVLVQEAIDYNLDEMDKIFQIAKRMGFTDGI